MLPSIALLLASATSPEYRPSHLLTHRPQRIQLLVVKLHPPAHSRFADHLLKRLDARLLILQDFKQIQHAYELEGLNRELRWV
jgi:hypothetical protein